jgi:hypothetical protein
MIRLLLLSAATAFALSACGGGDETSEGGLISPGNPENAEAQAPSEADRQSAAEQAVIETPEAEAALQRWAYALEARDWETARQVWAENGEASGLSAEEYAEAHEKYQTVSITIEDGRAEDNAGKLYFEGQVTMEGELQNGDAYMMQGPVVLSRVADLPGASTEELSWRIEMSDLRPRPVDEETGEPQ